MCIHCNTFSYTHTHILTQTHTHTKREKMSSWFLPSILAYIPFSLHTHTSPKADKMSLKGLITLNVSWDEYFETHACTHVQQSHTNASCVEGEVIWFRRILGWAEVQKVSRGCAYEAAFAVVVSRWRSACRWCDGLIWMGCRTLSREEMTWEKGKGFIKKLHQFS